MCSINEDDLIILPEICSEPPSDICKKCNNTATVILRKKDAYCTGCFTSSVNHKFRANLGKNKIIRPNQKIVVAISGDQATSVLLNLLHNGISDNSHKKLRVEAVCVYICDNLRENSKISELVLQQCKQYQLALYIVNYSSVLNNEFILSEPNTIPTIDPMLDEKLNTLVRSISSETSRIDFLSKLRRRLLIRCAEQLKCDFILTGEISTSLACTMLSNMSLGRGAQIGNDIGFCDSRDNIKILKPIKDLTLEEVQNYVKLTNLSHVSRIDPNTPNVRSSIQSTMRKFIMDLQENFPATISTICKTGEKMGEHEACNEPPEKCILCQSALDTQELKSSALQATNFSHLVSSTGPNQISDSAPSCVDCNCAKRQLSTEKVEQYICYGCGVILKDVNNTDLPVYFRDLVKTSVTMAKLRSEISDFLL